MFLFTENDFNSSSIKVTFLLFVWLKICANDAGKNIINLIDVPFSIKKKCVREKLKTGWQ
jgi:hypothetical protein